MNLKPKERGAIVRGEFPTIVRPHSPAGCPFKVGEILPVRQQKVQGGRVPIISIRITGKHRKDPKHWEALYAVKDDRGLYMAKGAGYTRSAASSLDWQAPVLDPDACTRYAIESRLSMAESNERSIEAEHAQERAARSELTETLKTMKPEARNEWLGEFKRLCEKAKSSSETPV